MSTNLNRVSDDAVSEVSRLEAVFGLSEHDVVDVVMQGLLARSSCSPHHPKTFPGLYQWAETVRALRDKTVPMGWGTRDENNFPLSVHPSKKIVIAVQTGDRDTGVRGGNPSNRAPKGANTEDAVFSNQQQLKLFDSIPALPTYEAGGGDSIMWVLLYHVASDEIRFELSLPMKMVGGKIRSWEERIVFRSVRFDDANIEIGDEDDNGTDIEIDIERRE